jgi:hypothetical protein
VCSKKSMPMCPPFLEKDTMPGSDFASRPTPPALVYLSDLDVSASLHCTTLVPAPSKPMMRHHTPFFIRLCLTSDLCLRHPLMMSSPESHSTTLTWRGWRLFYPISHPQPAVGVALALL